MMKKLYLLSLLCVASAIHADQLSNAIRLSDVQIVRLLLTEHRPTEKQLIKYLDIAEQMIRTRRDQLNFNISETPGSSSKAMDYYALTALASLAGIISFAVMKEYRYMKLSYMGLMISGIGLISCDIMNRSTLHENAITIKELLYDCVDCSN